MRTARRYDPGVWLLRNLESLEVALVVGAWIFLFVVVPLAARLIARRAA